MADDNRDYLPQRAVRAIEEPAAPAEGRLAAFRNRATKFALPAVLTLAVASGLTFGGLPQESAETQSLTAAPAPAALPDRDVSQVSRELDRLLAQEQTDAPAELPTAEPEPAVDAAPAPAEPQALSGFSASPEPTRAELTRAESASSGERMYATTTVNIRAEANASSARVGSLSRGDSVNTTGRTSNGFTQVNVNDRTGWVSSDYLSASAPAPSSRTTSSSGSSSAPSAPTGRSCAPLPGLQPRTAAVHQALCANFPGISSYGGVRSDWDVEHPSGRAIDAMTSSISTGDAVANWARANAGQYGITEVIWNQRIWTTQRAGEGWRAMGDRGSATANHRDHVHISVR